MIQALHKRLDIHVTNSCQLKCTGCNHYSNYGIHEHFTENTLVKWAEPWVDRIAFGKIQLVGGEPFLNKELKNICYSYRKLFPNTELLLFTDLTSIKISLTLYKLLNQVFSTNFNSNDFLR